ncbi:hypothetical protein D3C87_384500 [compost metagenome]
MATTSITSFPVPEKFDCPQCGSGITLYDPAGSEFCVCRFCQSYIQFVDEIPQKIKTLSPLELKPVIPLGTEGILQDISFKVIGYMEKDEGNKAYLGWREYVLYNYEIGYAILSEYNGHWNLLFDKAHLPNLEKVVFGNGYVEYDGYEYKLFHKYTPKLISLLGEFDWDVVKERVKTSEFIAPPYIIARETNIGTKTKDVNYYLGEYLEPEVIAEAFKLDITLFPAKVDIISNQPSKAYDNWKWSLHTTLYLILALLLIELFVVWKKPEQVLVDSVYNLTYDPDKGINEFKPFVSSAFKVEDDSSPLEIGISSGLNNSWLETTIVLVNEATNQTWEVTKGFEYYQGVEAGESWSEGETSAEVLLSEIPKGKYHLNIYTASGDPMRDALSIKVVSNVTLWRNLLICILVLSLFPAYTYLRMRNFEKRRWSNSDYSPFEE